MEATRRLLLVHRRQLEAIEVQPPRAVNFTGLWQHEMLLGDAAINVDANHLHHFWGRRSTDETLLERRWRESVQGSHRELAADQISASICATAVTADHH